MQLVCLFLNSYGVHNLEVNTLKTLSGANKTSKISWFGCDKMGSKTILKFMGEKKPRPEAIKFKGSTSIHQIYFLEVGEYSRKQSLLLCSSPAFVPIYLLRACASKKTRKFWACPCMTILTCPLEIITQTGTFRPPHTD